MLVRLTGSMLLAAVVGLTIVGCNDRPAGNRVASNSGPGAKAGDAPAGDTKHAAWWCDEHGIPEHECSQCLPEAKKKSMFKDKGDWCEIHTDRAKSQCFKCDPSKYERFEAKYVAKYNKKPAPPPAEEFEK